MQAQSSSYVRNFTHPLYPYSWVVANYTTVNTQEVAEDICTSNLKKAQFAIEKRLQSRLSCVEIVCRVAQSIDFKETRVIQGCKGIHTSIVVTSDGENKLIMIQRKDPHALVKKKKDTKTSKSFLFVFDKHNTLIDVEGAWRFAFVVPTEPEAGKSICKTQRQISIMQVCDKRPDLFARNYIYIQYKPNKIVVFQKRAPYPSDLLEHHNKVKSLYLTENRFEIARRVWEGMRYLHDNRIVHRDLKLDNILWFENEGVMVNDFDMSCRIEDEAACKMSVGTPGWEPPELLEKHKDKPFDYKAVDAWTLGHIFHLIINPQPAFKDGSLSSQSLVSEIVTIGHASKALLSLDPNKRPALSDLPLSIFHPSAVPVVEMNDVHVPPLLPSEPLATDITPRAEEPTPRAEEPASEKTPLRSASRTLHSRTCDLCCSVQ